MRLLPLPIKRLLVACLIAGSSVVSGFVQAVTLTDLPEGPLYAPYILSLAKHNIISGDTTASRGESRPLFPDQAVTRAELAKIAVLTRLGEKYGVQEKWNTLSEAEFVDKTETRLKPYYKCTTSSCSSIGGVPFGDVKEKDPECFKKGIETGAMCEPWYTQYVYYGISQSYIHGYENEDGTYYFYPDSSISRIQALEVIMGQSHSRLSALSESKNSYAPACLRGAEAFIVQNNKGLGSAMADQLLTDVILADRLDLFGKNCEGFGGIEDPFGRANFLQKSITRKEAARYLVLTTSYASLAVSPDSTVSTATENLTSAHNDPTYQMPFAGDINDPKSLINLSRRTGAVPEENTYVRTATVNNKTVAPSINTSAGPFGSTAGLAACPAALCASAGTMDCMSPKAGTRVTTLGEVVSGDYYRYSSLWQKVQYGGGTYYAPYDVLNLGCSSNTTVKIASYQNSAIGKMGFDQVNQNGPRISQPGEDWQPAPEGGWWQSTKNWFSPKRVEGFKQVGAGLLEFGGGLLQVGEGAAIAIGGTAASGGAAAPIAIVGGGAIAVMGANDIVGGATGIWGGLRNIFGSNKDEKIYNNRFNPIEKGIENYTEEGTWQRSAAWAGYVGASFGSLGTSVWDAGRFVLKNGVRESAVLVKNKAVATVGAAWNKGVGGFNALVENTTGFAKNIFAKNPYATKGLAKFAEQNIGKVEQILKEYESIQEAYRARLGNLNIKGVNVVNGDMKSATRILEKVYADKKYLGDVSNVKDIVRSTLSVDNPRAGEAAVEWAKKEFGIDIENVAKGFPVNPDTHFMGINKKIEINGKMVELQIAPREFSELTQALKDKGVRNFYGETHELMEKKRNYEVKIKEGGNFISNKWNHYQDKKLTNKIRDINDEAGAVYRNRITPAAPSRPVTGDPKLQNYMKDLYRELPADSRIGNGGVADAVIYTKKTNQLVGNSDHMKKATEYKNGLDDWVKKNDKGAIKNLFNSDYQKAKQEVTKLDQALKYDPKVYDAANLKKKQLEEALRAKENKGWSLSNWSEKNKIKSEIKKEEKVIKSDPYKKVENPTSKKPWYKW